MSPVESAALQKAEDRIRAAKINTRQELDLGDLRLEWLPKSLSSLTALTTLHLNTNQLKALPEWLGNLTALTTLYLGGNQLTHLPNSLGNLTALTTLNLGGNRLTHVPDTAPLRRRALRSAADRHPSPTYRADSARTDACSVLRRARRRPQPHPRPLPWAEGHQMGALPRPQVMQRGVQLCQSSRPGSAGSPRHLLQGTRRHGRRRRPADRYRPARTRSRHL
ncbi:leucine-rich repeat domain-containing protein [Catellatospora sp. NEAU-YM18]|nr:leucine-rich repeat domain-containing protein [Catellatospora tritici]